MTRRGFITALLAGAALLPDALSYAARGPHKKSLKRPSARRRAKAEPVYVIRKEPKTERFFKLYNWNESLDIKFWENGEYDAEALDEINRFMRCPLTGEVKEMDIRVLDLLADIKDVIGTDKKVRVVSAYRSPEYNALLRRKSRRVSRGSLHMDGLAVDFTIDGVGSRDLAKIAKAFSGGGVGRYRKFIHIDSGPVRYW